MSILGVILALTFPTSEKAVQRPLRTLCDYRCLAVRPYDAKLNRMAWCESRGRWFINSGNGFYGGLQFLLSTWQSKAVGGRGYPNKNSILEQKYRAVRLIRVSGYRPWPICGSA
jgi:hypothetical protein